MWHGRLLKGEFLEDSRHVHLLLPSEIRLVADGPSDFAVPEFREHGCVQGVKLVLGTEEAVEPEDATRTEDAMDVEQDELQHVTGHPVAEDVHGVHDVQCVVKEREALRDREVHG